MSPGRGTAGGSYAAGLAGAAAAAHPIPGRARWPATKKTARKAQTGQGLRADSTEEGTSAFRPPGEEACARCSWPPPPVWAGEWKRWIPAVEKRIPASEATTRIFWKIAFIPRHPRKSAAEFPCLPAGSRRHGSLLLPGPGGRVNPRGRIGTRACSSWEAPQAPPDAALGEEGTRRKNGIGLQTKASWAGSTAAPETQGSQTGMEIRRLPAFRHRGHKGKAKEKGDSSLRRGDAGEGKTLGQTKGALRSSLCTLCLCGEKRFE